MNTDELVRELARQGTPVRRLPGAGTRTLAFCAGAFALVLLLLAAHGVRADWRAKLGDASFVREQVALLALFALAAYSDFHLSVPGKRGAALAKVLPLVGLCVWVALVGSRHLDGHELGAPGWRCAARMTGLALLPLAGLTLALRRAPPLDAARAVAFALWSSCSLATFGTQWLCARDAALHVLVWHVGPVVLSGVCAATLVTLGRGAGRRLDRS